MFDCKILADDVLTTIGQIFNILQNKAVDDIANGAPPPLPHDPLRTTHHPSLQFAPPQCLAPWCVVLQ